MAGKLYDTGEMTWTHVEGGNLGPCRICGVVTMERAGIGWRCLNDSCRMSEAKASPSAYHCIPDWWDSDINVKMDGDQWCAFRDDFVDLQESDAGFGDSPEEAVENLRSVTSD